MQLEEELGVKLFRRSQHHIVLTEAGMLLRRRAQEIVELAEKTARELRPAEEVTGRISIGSGDLRSMTYLAKLLAAFHRQHPRVQYEIYSGDSDGIKERIEQGLLDMGLLLEPVDTSRYQILRLPVRESWGVLVPEDSPLARREAVTPGDLADSPLILTTRELMRREMIRWFGPYADRIQVAASGNLPYNQTQLAREGLGIYLVIRLDCAYDGLRFVPPLSAAGVGHGSGLEEDRGPFCHRCCPAAICREIRRRNIRPSGIGIGQGEVPDLEWRRPCGDVSTFCPEVRAMTIQEASECDQISMEVLRSGRPRPGAAEPDPDASGHRLHRRGDGGLYAAAATGGDTGRRAGGYSHP